MTSAQIECAVARHFEYRVNLIVPNVSFGLGLYYEADMVIVRTSGWAMEIEIKVSASDIVADTKKRHHHDSVLFRQVWFAVPTKLTRHPAIPENFGILGIDPNPYRGNVAGIGWKEGELLRVSVVRPATIRKYARKLTDTEIRNLGRLAAMRVWSLKEKLQADRLKMKSLASRVLPDPRTAPR